MCLVVRNDNFVNKGSISFIVDGIKHHASRIALKNAYKQIYERFCKKKSTLNWYYFIINNQKAI